VLFYKYKYTNDSYYLSAIPLFLNIKFANICCNKVSIYSDLLQLVIEILINLFAIRMAMIILSYKKILKKKGFKNELAFSTKGIFK